MDLCGSTERLVPATVLHEMAHAWLDSHVTAGLEERLRLRRSRGGTTTMTSGSIAGSEHAGEIVEWALAGQGTGTELPSIPENEPPQLAQAYELLTGRQLPD